MSRYIVNRANVTDWYVSDTLAKAPAEGHGRTYPDREYAQDVADRMNASYADATRSNVHAAIQEVRDSRYRRLVLLLRWHVTRNGYMQSDQHPLSGWYWRRLSHLQTAMDRAAG
jgi:hypothetical protein